MRTGGSLISDPSGSVCTPMSQYSTVAPKPLRRSPAHLTMRTISWKEAESGNGVLEPVSEGFPPGSRKFPLIHWQSLTIKGAFQISEAQSSKPLISRDERTCFHIESGSVLLPSSISKTAGISWNIFTETHVARYVYLERTKSTCFVILKSCWQFCLWPILFENYWDWF